MDLTKHLRTWQGEDQNLYPITKPIQYEVLGLPLGEQAEIAKFGERWRIFRIQDSNQGDWAGDYKSEDEALETLQKEYNA